MYNSNHSSSINHYQNIHVSTGSGMVDADPHKLVQLLYQGLLDKMAKAKGHIARGEIEARNNTLKRCMDIVDYLRMILDHDASTTLSANLESLYNYMEERLFQANQTNDVACVDEVARLIITLKSGWDNIPDVARKPARTTANAF
jgi:flagellar protein FliS